MRWVSRFLLLCLFVVPHPALASSQNSDSQPIYQSAGTRRMADLLRKIYDETDWKADPNKPEQRAQYYRELLARGLSIDQEIPVRIEHGNELLRSGDSAGAVAA